MKYDGWTFICTTPDQRNKQSKRTSLSLFPLKPNNYCRIMTRLRKVRPNLFLSDRNKTFFKQWGDVSKWHLTRSLLYNRHEVLIAILCNTEILDLMWRHRSSKGFLLSFLFLAEGAGGGGNNQWESGFIGFDHVTYRNGLPKNVREWFPVPVLNL